MRLVPPSLTFTGRISREQLWRGWLSLILAHLGLALLTALIVVSIVLAGGGTFRTYEPILGRLGSVISILLLPWWASLFARRFHDLGWPGWAAAAPVAMMLIGSIEDLLEEGREPLNPFMLPGLGAPILAIYVAGVVCCFFAGLAPGQPRPNRHGSPAERPLLTRIQPTDFG